MEKGDVPIVRLLVIYAPTRSLDFFHQYHGMSRHAGAVPGESQPLLRGGLYIDLLRGDVQRCGHIFCHLLSIRANLRGLRQQYCIDIHHGIAFFRQQTPHLRQQL